MNEKIKKLMKECYVSVSERDGDNEYDMEKFAELIILKCADISEDNFHNGFAGAREMKTHFGVE